MHGSPLSKYNNRDLWKKYNYKDFGIIGEPYFDVDFDKVFYITDTGRCWDGERVSVRDRVGKGEEGRGQGLGKKDSFHSTYDILTALKNKQFPAKAMFTIHPQRWTDSGLPWVKELVLQNLKNLVKRMIVKKRKEKLL
jgi:hypothetical protein